MKDKNKKIKEVLVAPVDVIDVPKDTKATVKRLFRRLARQKGKLIFVTIACFLSAATYSAAPLLVGVAIDDLLGVIQGGGSAAQGAEAILLPVLFLVVGAALTSLLAYLQQYVVASVGEELTLSIRKDISAKMNRLPLQYFDTHTTGDIMSRATNDLEKVSEVMQVGLMQFISATFTIILTFGAMLFLSPKLFLVVVVAIGVSAVATNYVSGLSQRYYADNQAAVGALNSQIEELYTGNRIVKIFNQQPVSIQKVAELNQNQFLANRRAQFANFAIYPSIRLINQLGFIATAIVGGMMALGGALTVGTVQAFLQYVNQVSEPITEASYVITSLQSGIAGAERVFTFLDETEEVPDSTQAALLPAKAEGRVKFNHVRFGYNKEKILMKDLSLEVKPNEMVAIVGPTGGGKTTLINLLMRFYEVSGGSISVDGVDITNLSRGELRRHIGMVLQDTWLFEGTVAENIAYGKKDATREEVIAAARAARCDHFIRTLPDSYETIISSEASHISQGQMQLLTIARAMLTNPTIMILDEATSSVDTRTEVEIQKAMTHLMQDKTSFVIAHRLSTIQNADLILVVKEGDIVERGTHKALLQADGFYASLYNSQFEQEASVS